MSYVTNFMAGAVLACACFDLGAHPVEEKEAPKSLVINGECLDPKSERLGQSSMNDYWTDVASQHSKLVAEEGKSKRSGFQRHFIDRVKFTAGYGTDYNIALDDGDRAIKTTDGRSASLSYEIPLSAVFSTSEQRNAPAAQKRLEREMALAKEESDFMKLAYDFKIAVAKADEDRSLSALYAAEQLAARIAALSPGFEKNCLAR